MKVRLMFEHHALIKSGQYEPARRLLRFINSHRIVLGLDDNDWTLEHLFDKIGVKCVYASRWGNSTEYVY